MFLYDMPTVSPPDTVLIAQTALPNSAQSQKMQAITLDWGWTVPSDPQYSYEPGSFVTNPGEEACGALLQGNNHPPAKPGVFNFVSRSKRLNGVAHAAPTLGATSTVALISTARAVPISRLPSLGAGCSCESPLHLGRLSRQNTLAPRNFAL